MIGVPPRAVIREGSGGLVGLWAVVGLVSVGFPKRSPACYVLVRAAFIEDIAEENPCRSFGKCRAGMLVGALA